MGIAGSRAGDPRALRRGRKASRMTPATETAKRIGRGTLKPGNWIQLLQFGIVGGSGYLINLAVFAVVNGALDIHYIPAAIIAFCVAVTNNFWWNRHWRLSLAVLALHHRADRVDGAHLDRFEDSPVVRGPIPVVVRGDHQPTTAISLA